ncbi:RDD family protein [Nocardia sp. bgisy118]|uniref:RDD family protein n=1 Tax=Nocardia sp. bgisy118 TaxID=3413786 RepID=UPI003F4A444E
MDERVEGRRGDSAVARFERHPDGTLRYVRPEEPKEDEFPMVGSGRHEDEKNGVQAAVAFVIDLALHAAIGVGVWYAANRYGHAEQAVFFGVLAGIGCSFLHRTVVQRLTRTTLGKALFGLRLRKTDRSYPTLWELVRQWFQGAIACMFPLQFLG